MPASATIALTEILARSEVLNKRCPASSSALRPGSEVSREPTLAASRQHLAVLLADVNHPGEREVIQPLCVDGRLVRIAGGR